jgi:hypothetical protein
MSDNKKKVHKKASKSDSRRRKVKLSGDVVKKGVISSTSPKRPVKKSS